VRPPREAYARATVNVGGFRPSFDHGFELIAGLELRDGDEFGDLRDRLILAMRNAWAEAGRLKVRGDTIAVAAAVERWIVKDWPDRYWFLEVCSLDDRDGWVQVYQPPERT
jgi:hypothetical protein